MKVFIGVPTYDGRIDVCATSALVNNTRMLEKAGHDVQIYYEIGCCYIATARNRIVGEFLDSGADRLIMLDSDLWVEQDAMLKLISFDYPVTAVSYQYRHGTEGWPIRVFTNGDGTPRVNDDGTIPSEVIPTGCMCITRITIETLILMHGEWKTQNVTTKGNPIYAVFDTGLTRNDGHWYGEDYEFCQRCRDHGLQVVCVPNITTEHAGGRNNRIGNYHKYLSELPKPEEVTA